jgi:hypothetical protein
MPNSDEPPSDRDGALRAALMNRVAREGSPGQRRRPTMLAIGAGLVVAMTALVLFAITAARTGPDTGPAASPSATTPASAPPSEISSESALALDSAQQSDSSQPPTVAGPPAIGMWQLANAAEVKVDSTIIHLSVTRLECAGGETGTVLPAEVTYETDRILIRTPVAELPPGAHTCPENNSVPITVQLSEPVGSRQLIDIACVEGEAVTTAFCEHGSVRWRP